MFLKETFRLIKSTYKRFIALVLMTFIGVSFMMGLMSTRRIMIESVDKYYDEYCFQDIQLVSQFGFCSEDISELSKLIKEEVSQTGEIEEKVDFESPFMVALLESLKKRGITYEEYKKSFQEDD